MAVRGKRGHCRFCVAQPHLGESLGLRVCAPLAIILTRQATSATKLRGGAMVMCAKDAVRSASTRLFSSGGNTNKKDVAKLK